MISVIEKIKAELNDVLADLSSVESLMERAALGSKETYDRLREVIRTIADYKFRTEAEETVFFKCDLPQICLHYIYWSKVLDLLVRKLGKNPETVAVLLKRERDDIQSFYCDNELVLKLYIGHITNFDRQLYQRNAAAWWPSSEMASIVDSNFPRASAIIAKHLAYAKYQEFLSDQEEFNSRSNFEAKLPRIQLLLSDADIAELIPPIHDLKLLLIDGKAPSQAQLLDLIDSCLHRNIKANFSIIDNKNRARKKGMTPLLQRMIDVYTERSQRLSQ